MTDSDTKRGKQIAVSPSAIVVRCKCGVCLNTHNKLHLKDSATLGSVSFHIMVNDSVHVYLVSNMLITSCENVAVAAQTARIEDHNQIRVRLSDYQSVLRQASAQLV